MIEAKELLSHLIDRAHEARSQGGPSPTARRTEERPRCRAWVQFDPQRTYSGALLREMFEGATIEWDGAIPTPVPGVTMTVVAE